MRRVASIEEPVTPQLALRGIGQGVALRHAGPTIEPDPTEMEIVSVGKRRYDERGATPRPSPKLWTGTRNSAASTAPPARPAHSGLHIQSPHASERTRTLT